MNPKRLVKLSNIIGVVSILLLIYWVFVFVSIEVFGLKVFKENITETFYMSIMGILALMFGALMINIMFNLTRIADRQNADDNYKSKNVKKLVLGFVLSFPLLFAFLVGGDYYTAYNKEKAMIKAAETIIENNEEQVKAIADYSYSKEWIDRTQKQLSYFSKVDRYFPRVSVLVRDTMDNYNVYLEYNRYTYLTYDTILPGKYNLIKPTTQVERDYLSKVFNEQSTELRYSKHDGNYELFYPYTHDGKTVVFYFSDYQQYGKVAYSSYDNYSEEAVGAEIALEPINAASDSISVEETVEGN